MRIICQAVNSHEMSFKILKVAFLNKEHIKERKLQTWLIRLFFCNSVVCKAAYLFLLKKDLLRLSGGCFFFFFFFFSEKMIKKKKSKRLLQLWLGLRVKVNGYNFKGSNSLEIVLAPYTV